MFCSVRAMMKKREKTWQFLIGPNVQLWKAFPASGAAAGVFRGTRMPVSAVFENLQDMSVNELVDEFDVTREQVKAVLQFVAHSTEAEALRP
jgi:uncharacterized protein (DUF433 family)